MKNSAATISLGQRKMQIVALFSIHLDLLNVYIGGLQSSMLIQVSLGMIMAPKGNAAHNLYNKSYTCA